MWGQLCVQIVASEMDLKSNYYVYLFILFFKLAYFNNCFKILLTYNFKM